MKSDRTKLDALFGPAKFRRGYNYGSSLRLCGNFFNFGFISRVGARVDGFQHSIKVVPRRNPGDFTTNFS